MRRRTFGDYWFLFVLFIIFGGSGLLPLAIIFGAFFAVMYAAVKAANRTTVSNTNAYRRKTNSYGYTQRKTGNAHTAADLAKINVYLRKYFRTNTQLEMPNGIELFLRTDSYSNLDNLDVYKKEYKDNRYKEYYYKYKINILLDLILEKRKEEIINEEYSHKIINNLINYYNNNIIYN